MLKDARLEELAGTHNIARFLSCDEQLRVRVVAIGERVPEYETLEETVCRLLSRVQTVNVRSFHPDGSTRSTPFKYGLKNATAVMQILSSNASRGLYSVVNETIDVSDGGVSGVVDMDVVEFGPDETPRGVEGDAFGRLPKDIANSILGRVYRLDGPLQHFGEGRTEFSLHPNPVGTRQGHVITWEEGDSELRSADPLPVAWPRSFAALIGDKTLGLLIADALGLRVPATQVIARRLSPFRFGRATNSSVRWIRTAPVVQQPGRFTTSRLWMDPFKLLQDEDPDGTQIAAVLSQDEVTPKFSGAASEAEEGRRVVEGVRGFGDAFMLGDEGPEDLPAQVVSAVELVMSVVRSATGCRAELEWAWDGSNLWVLQLHLREVSSNEQPTSKHAAEEWVSFDPAQGLEELQMLITARESSSFGVSLTRRVGITSHLGDLLRRNGVPFRFEGSS